MNIMNSPKFPCFGIVLKFDETCEKTKFCTHPHSFEVTPMFRSSRLNEHIVYTAVAQTGGKKNMQPQ